MMDIASLSLADFLDALADRVADRIAERDESLVDQRDRRGLMGRRHIEAVKRRMSAGEPGAYVRGRDYLLTPAAVRDELERFGRRRRDDFNEPAAVAARARRAANDGATDQQSAELEALSRKLDAELAGAAASARRKH